MTKIVEWAVANTKLIGALILMVIIGGIYAITTIPKESDPDVPIPYIGVYVSYPGVSPEDSERLILRPLETALRSVQGIRHVNAWAYQGGVSINIEFQADTKMAKALADVRAQVDSTRSRLPKEADPPVISEASTSDNPVITVALSGNLPERALLHITRALRDEIRMIPSVLEAEINGARNELLEITIDPAKLETYGITQTEIYNAVTSNNTLIAAGTIETGKGSFQVKVPGVIATAQDVLNLPIRATADSTIRLQDVAQVHRTFVDPNSYARMNGQPTMGIEVKKRVGTNLIETNAKVKEIVEKAQKTWPAGVHATFMFDQSTFIAEQLGSLFDSILLAIILVMVIIVAALGVRSGLLVGIAIPTSFLMAFLVLNGVGYTLNFMIMFAMLLAVGILVDGAIIVVEYADRKMTEGHPPKQAFAEAAVRMFWPVVSATATMIGAFVPMLLWPGIVGSFMSYFPITLIAVLTSSMIVALIFLPVMGGWFGKPPAHDEEHEKAIAASEHGDWHDIPGITGWYAHLAEKLTHHPGRVMLGAAGIVIAVLVSFVFFNKGIEFFVTTDPDMASIYVSARGNLSAAEKRDLLMQVENRIEGVEGIKYFYARTGSGGNNAPVDVIGRITVEMKPMEERTRTGKAILEEVRKRTTGMAGIRVEVREPQSGPSNSKDVVVDVTSEDFGSLLQVVDAVRRHMDASPELRDIEDTRALPGIEWNMQIDRELASRFGVNTYEVGTAVQLVTNGIYVARYRPDDTDEEVDIRVRYPSLDRGVHALDDLRIPTNNGVVPMSSFVKVVPGPKTNTIEHADSRRVYHIRANMKPNTILPNAEMAKIKEWIGKQNFPSNVHVAFKGSTEDQDESMAFLSIAGIMALGIIAVVLLAMFNSIYHTSLILVAVILAMIGALLGMVVMGQTFSVIMTGTGLLALAGVVVNHNIVLIDTFHRHLKDGMEPIEAVIRSSAQRLRPVFLTTITAIGGLLPMMYAVEIDFWQRSVTIGSVNAMMWIQISTAIVFGLAFSKMITLGLIPAMLALPYRMKEKRAARRAAKEAHELRLAAE
ncbi:multidrug efflux pump [Rhizomicrobium palustre]|uniref:Multidrug efflux pump n=1 Tax=Rhizomicrobium palustre TaxID=189966 RepID=A0A846MUM6_9PROT|nr:efflux RND transporter permease subunit [Rhizomicrobium palustre]NIK87208.1 multidrug efflux pump [Rhizomicrobium palustre]